MKTKHAIILAMALAIASISNAQTCANGCCQQPAKTAAKQPAAAVTPVAAPAKPTSFWRKLAFWKRDTPQQKAAPAVAPVAPAKPAGKAPASRAANHFACAPGPHSDCKCAGMGSPAPVCTGICRPDSCRCGVPVAPCRGTCQKGKCECPKRPPPAAHPCNCPGMQKAQQKEGIIPVAPITGVDCGSSCGTASGFTARLAPNLAPTLPLMAKPVFINP